MAISARLSPPRREGQQGSGRPSSCTRRVPMNPPDSSQWILQIVWLLVLAVPIACVAWTVTHEEIFKEPRDFCAERSQHARSLAVRKFFYLFTCEYCFSH